VENQTSKHITLLSTTLASFLAPFIGASINVALPAIGSEFSLDAISLSWITTSFLLASAAFLIPFGRLADMIGRKRVFLAGVLLFSFSSLFLAISPAATWLFVFRVVQGMASAMLFSTAVAILISVYPVTERGKVLGINVASVYLGLSLGPFLGGLLTQYWGWRSIFILCVALGALIAFFVIWKLPGEWQGAPGETFDLIGSAIYALSLIALMYGFSTLPDRLGVGLLAGGLIGLIGFAVWETRTTSPVLNLRLFRHNRVFALSGLAALIHYGATYSVSMLLSLYLQYIKELSPRDAGLILVAQPVMQMLFSPLAGRLSDRIEPRLIASTGMGLTAVGLCLFSFLGDETRIGSIVAILLLMGFGFALFSSPNTNAIMGAVERQFYGVASATVGTMRSIGQMLSMGIVMVLFAVVVGRVEITPAQYSQFLHSVNIAFAIMTALCLAGVFASLARGRAR
jgi:EmrB/QacA subfamily drug resistance transporter